MMPSLSTLNLYPWQLEALNELLRGGRVNALSMPTGSGKTLTALLYALRLGVDKIIFLTRTINEERAPWNEWRGLLRNGIAEGDVATLHGKTHFCPEELLDDDGDPIEDCAKCELNADNFVSLSRMLSLVDDVLVAMGNIDPTVRGIREAYARAVALPEKACVYQYTKDAVKNAKLIIGPYPYLLLPQVSDAVINRIIDSGSILVIIDEAHNLDGLTDLMSVKVSRERLIETANALDELCHWVYCPTLGIAHEEIIGALHAIAYDLGLMLDYWAKDLEVGLTMHVNDKETVRMILRSALNVLNPLVDAEMEDKIMKRIGELVRVFGRKVYNDNRKLYQKIKKTHHVVSSILDYIDNPHEGWGIYIYREKTRLGIMLRPILAREVYKWILEELYSLNAMFLLMSGTLPSPEYIEHVYGFKVDRVVVKNPRLGAIKVKIDGSLTSKYEARGREMYEKYGKRISRIVKKAKPSVILVVYPSYGFMRNVLPYLNVEDAEVFNEDETRELNTIINSAVKAVKERRKVVVNAVAGGRFTEGIEVKDGERSLIKYIIIAGVPYPNPNDAVFQDMAKASSLEPGALMREIGRIRTLQAIGRGVRGLKDTVTVWLLDERFDGPRGLAVKWGLVKPSSGH